MNVYSCSAIPAFRRYVKIFKWPLFNNFPPFSEYLGLSHVDINAVIRKVELYS
jgi:hypothetical protein